MDGATGQVTDAIKTAEALLKHPFLDFLNGDTYRNVLYVIYGYITLGISLIAWSIFELIKTLAKSVAL